MSNVDIYTILSSKPHNKHHLNRYFNFILACSQANSGKTKEELGYTEKHHICPRAKDLFPEYKSFTKNPWNGVVLTARQHFIAHWMLWKAYGGSQSFAFRTLRNVNGKSINGNTYEKMRIDTSGNNAPMKGKTHSENTKRKISESVKSMQLNVGKTHSENTKRKISESKIGKCGGRKHPLFDHKIYTFLNVETNETVQSTRFDFRKNFYNEKKDAKLFPIGKISRGWKIIDCQSEI